MNIKNIIWALVNKAIQFAVILYVYEIDIFGTPSISYAELDTIMLNNYTKPNKLIIDEINSKAYFFENSTELFKIKISRYENFANLIKTYYDDSNKPNIVYDIQYNYLEYAFVFIKQIMLIILLLFIINFFIDLLITFGKYLFNNSSTKDKLIDNNTISESESDSDFGSNSIGGIGSMLFSNNIFKVSKNIQTRFTDVIGQNNVKHDLNRYIHFLKNRSEYIKYGAKIPKGLLFTGPPGTVKHY